MSETRVMNCIMCPMGCEMTVTIEDGKVVDVKGLREIPARAALNTHTTK